MEIRLAAPLQYDSIVDGEGMRIVLWTQGCPHNCIGCHNPSTHSFKDGFLTNTEDIIKDLSENIKYHDGITLSGGDPFIQAKAVNEIASYIKSEGKDVWAYTGYDFEQLLKSWPQPRGVEANFGVIDAQGHGAYFETGNYTLVKYDLSEEPSGILIRTNYSYSGRKDEGAGYVREGNEKHLLEAHVERCDITPAVFTEELSRTFYHSVLGKDFTHSSEKWIVDQDFIPRRISTASIVVEGVMPEETPLLTTMWVALGYPPCAEVFPVWLWENGVPECLVGTGKNNHAPQCDIVNKREKEVFSIKRGNGQHYINLQKLYNAAGTGYCQKLIPQNMETYRKAYEQINQQREQFK